METSTILAANSPDTSSRLWTVKDVSVFLGRSPRWVWSALVKAPNEAGSIPYIRLPGNRKSPRFISEDIKEWISCGCPPASDFQLFKAAKAKKR